MKPIYKIACMSRPNGWAWFVFDATAVDRNNDPHNFKAWSARQFEAATSAECDAWIDTRENEHRATIARDGEAA